MFRESAYFLAENSGLDAGLELEDWLAAEEQIALALTKKAETALPASRGPSPAPRGAVLQAPRTAARQTWSDR